MADFSDVTAALKAAIVNLAYPNGTLNANGAAIPSALGVEIQVVEGWPLAATLDKIAGKPGVTPQNSVSLVSIYPVPGTSGDGGTYMDMGGTEVSRATAGLSAAVDGAAVSIAGMSAGDENVVLIANGAPYAYSAQAGVTAQTVATALLAQIAGALPDATLDVSSPTAAEIDVTGAYSLVARVGVVGTIAFTTHVERQQVRVVVWSSNPVDRNTVGKAIDQFVKSQVRLPLPDGTASIVTYSGSNWSDDPERIGLFRRDILFSATCDAIDEIDAVEVIAVGFQTTLPNGSVITSAS